MLLIEILFVIFKSITPLIILICIYLTIILFFQLLIEIIKTVFMNILRLIF
jgi:hypothetical protein